MKQLEGWILFGLIHPYIGFVMKLPVIKMQPCSVSATVSHEYVFQNLRKYPEMLLVKVETFLFSPSQ